MWNLEKFGKNTAFITEAGKKITYTELNTLQENFLCGLKIRSLIFIICTNTLESVTAYISSIMNEIVPMLLDSSISKDMLYTLLDSYMPEYLYAPASSFNNIFGYAIIRQDNIYILYKREKSISYKINNNLALLLPTSGSTGSPKYVRLSYVNIDDNTKAITDYLHINEKDRTVTSFSGVPYDKYIKLMGKRFDLSHMEQILFEQYGVSYICNGDNDKIKIFGEGDEKDILNFISQRIGVNKRLLQFYKQKIHKWKETIEEETKTV